MSSSEAGACAVLRHCGIESRWRSRSGPRAEPAAEWSPRGEPLMTRGSRARGVPVPERAVPKALRWKCALRAGVYEFGMDSPTHVVHAQHICFPPQHPVTHSSTPFPFATSRKKGNTGLSDDPVLVSALLSLGRWAASGLVHQLPLQGPSARRASGCVRLGVPEVRTETNVKSVCRNDPVLPDTTRTRWSSDSRAPGWMKTDGQCVEVSAAW